jgi:hypothetical protein
VAPNSHQHRVAEEASGAPSEVVILVALVLAALTLAALVALRQHSRHMQDD